MWTVKSGWKESGIAMSRWRVSAGVLGAVCAAAILVAQEDVIRVNVNLVNVTATVRVPVAPGQSVVFYDRSNTRVLGGGLAARRS